MAWSSALVSGVFSVCLEVSPHAGNDFGSETLGSPAQSVQMSLLRDTCLPSPGAALVNCPDLSYVSYRTQRRGWGGWG